MKKRTALQLPRFRRLLLPGASGTRRAQMKISDREQHRPTPTPECVHPRYYPGEPTGPFDILGSAAWAEEML
jgi:hypothetical protein